MLAYTLVYVLDKGWLVYARKPDQQSIEHVVPSAGRMLAALVRLLWLRAWMLLRDLAGVTSARDEADPNGLARDDDVLDAWLDDEGMDATGL